MIVLFGPAGAGKSVQGQILAARMGWRWLSAGQMLRDSKDPELAELLHQGKLAPHEKVVKVMGDAIGRGADIEHLILDGFPREMAQAQWLIESQPEHGRSVELVVVLEVPREELLVRLAVRGRVDDTPEVIDDRLRIYHHEIYPILGYFTEQNVPVVHIDGVGTVGQVHDRIVKELTDRKIA